MQMAPIARSIGTVGFFVCLVFNLNFLIIGIYRNLLCNSLHQPLGGEIKGKKVSYVREVADVNVLAQFFF